MKQNDLKIEIEIKPYPNGFSINRKWPDERWGVAKGPAEVSRIIRDKIKEIYADQK